MIMIIYQQFKQMLVSAQAPQAATKEKTLCCWFCASGPISLSAKIERKGYTPGEPHVFLIPPTFLFFLLLRFHLCHFSVSLIDWSHLPSFQGESIQIFAEVENCSSRVVVPKAALYQTQTFFAKGKGKQIQQLVSNVRGDPLLQGKSQSWEGKLLKIPPVSPSILDCPIIRVEYALMVSSRCCYRVSQPVFWVESGPFPHWSDAGTVDMTGLKTNATL